MTKAKIIDGKGFAKTLREKVTGHVAALKETHDVTPGLAVVLVGDDPASQVYVNSKEKLTQKAGMNSFVHRLPENTSQDELLRLVTDLNADDAVNGILVQLPLPKQIDEDTVIRAIAPVKDVDGLHVENIGRLAAGQPGMVPCTPLGCLMLLQDELGDLGGKHAVVVGRSKLVGKPIAQLLLQANCTVTMAHSRTRDLPDVCKLADILVVAVGQPEMVKGDWVKPGAVVIDVGINRADEGLLGDVAFDEAAEIAAAITPVPGGVGPMTVACLLANTLTATCRQHELTIPDLAA